VKTKLALPFLLALSNFCFEFSTHAQSTAFTYQGRLSDGTSPANGSYDLMFALFNVSNGAGQAGNTITNTGVAVSNGLFTVLLDFGPNFPGADRWLEIGVRSNGAASFNTLTPRQKLTASPYAITAGNVVSGGIASGTYSNAVTFKNAANNFSGGFSGDGAALTNVNASSIGGLASSNFWQLGGNRVVAGQFIGTTNNQPLEFRVNGVRALRLELNGDGAPNVIGGSPRNFVSGASGAFIGGGGATNSSGGIAYTNKVTDDFGVVVGGANNSVGREYGFIGGGLNNVNDGRYSVTGGGQNNSVSPDYCVIAGGINNTIQGFNGNVIGGGSDNTVGGSALDCTVAGGSGNFVSGLNSAVAGGAQNSASGFDTVVGGGIFNTNSGDYATIPGGRENRAAAAFSFAAGHQAYALHGGAFVWADNSTNAVFASTSVNQFLIRASGGVGIGTTAPGAPLHIAQGSAGTVTPNANSIAAFERSGNGYVSILSPAANEAGVLFGDPNSNVDGGIIFNASNARSGMEFRTGTNVTQMTIVADGNVGIGTTNPSRELEVQNTGDTEIGIKSTDTDGHLWSLQSSAVNGGANDASFQIIDRTLASSRFYIGTNGFVGIGTTGPTNRLHVNGGITCVALTQTSDRNAKENFAPVSPLDVLDKVAALPITTWNFKELHDGRHIGPMAQDFYAAFHLGGSDTTITSVDPDGVALVAIQGLNEKVEVRSQKSENRIQKLETENAELRNRLEKLEKVIQGLRP
jgi:hypothetical protein